MYIGIDLGTSGVKAILFSEDQRILASHSEPLENWLTPLPLEASYVPEAAHHQRYQTKRRLFAELYRQLAALRLIGHRCGEID